MALGLPRDATRGPWIQGTVLFAVTAVLYGLLPTFEPPGISGQSDVILIGMILGLAVGLGLRVEQRLVPAICLGAFAGIVARQGRDSMSLDTRVVLALGIAVELWVMVFVIRRTGGHRFAGPIDVLMLVTVAVGVSLVASSLGAVVLRITSGEVDAFWQSIRSWVADDVFGVVVLAPAVVLLRRPARWPWDHALEFVIVSSLTLLATFFIFYRVDHDNPGLLGWPYLIILGPIWLAVRLGAAAVAPLLAVTFWLAAVATANGMGAFAAASSESLDRLVAVELFGIVMAFALLTLGVLRDDRLRTLARLQESARLLREVVNGAQALVFAKSYVNDDSHTGRYVLVNDTWVQRLGIPAEDTLGRGDAELFPAYLADEFLQNDRAILSSNMPMVFEEEDVSPEGDPRYYSSSKFPLRDEEGVPWGVGGIATDVSELVHARAREQRQTALLRAVFELSPTPAMRFAVGEHGGIHALDANAAMCALMGARDGELEQCDLMDHVHRDDAAAAQEILTAACRGKVRYSGIGSRRREVRLETNDGRTVWTLMSAALVGAGSSADAAEVVVQFEDFTARREAEEALSDQALRDTVTGLPNRRALQDRLGSALQRLRRTPGIVAVLFCDLDRFKDVNDTQGHQVGDELLIEVARRMQAALRPEDTVARLGGDEFVAMGEGIVDSASAVQLAMRLLEKINAPWLRGEMVYRPSVSIGVALVDDPDMTADEVLRRADMAMYRAKENGRGRIEIYEKSVDDQYQYSVALQHDLRRAIDSDTLVLHYQPIVRLQGGELVGAEALVRMPGDGGALLEPGLFVPAAETSGLVIPMGAWVVRRAIAQLKGSTILGEKLSISVNVSPSQLRDEGFADFVLTQVDSAGVDPARLAVEVTETALLNEPGRSARELNTLSREGIGIYLDDFGTGYSSLSWLTHFPVDVVKIDRSFTQDLGIDDRKTAIVSALIQVSHDLGFSVVAEGVETRFQADLLIDLGCDQGQGFLFGRPVAIGNSPWV
jgi:diguanylate cyclase (GGDEF)-like protein/PAS domain S-box-containing protein